MLPLVLVLFVACATSQRITLHPVPDVLYMSSVYNTQFISQYRYTDSPGYNRRAYCKGTRTKLADLVTISYLDNVSVHTKNTQNSWANIVFDLPSIYPGLPLHNVTAAKLAFNVLAWSSGGFNHQFQNQTGLDLAFATDGQYYSWGYPLDSDNVIAQFTAFPFETPEKWPFYCLSDRQALPQATWISQIVKETGVISIDVLPAIQSLEGTVHSLSLLLRSLHPNGCNLQGCTPLVQIAVKSVALTLDYS